MRQLVAVVVGATVAALGALVAGEYELRGVVALAAGAAIGLAVAEAVVLVGGAGGGLAAPSAAALGAAGTVWAGWIDSGRGLEPYPAWAWAGAAAAAAVAAWRAGRRRPVRA